MPKKKSSTAEYAGEIEGLLVAAIEVRAAAKLRLDTASEEIFSFNLTDTNNFPVPKTNLFGPIK